MYDGQKQTARKLVYGALKVIETQTKQNPVEVFELAIKNASPMLEVKSRRVGGATYQVPREVRGERRMALAFRWLISAARNRKAKNMIESLSAEIIDASNNTGPAIKKKEDTHRMAEANRAFAHFAW
ncbi:MAG: 30S ribosomal protein S7 [Parcubacteria group bacterium GW2011_GWB1_40_14]|nr:MAG: 30S ribosomal protein S7 [Parcubacteria group bacterium GW2011_GWB1_40_14]